MAQTVYVLGAGASYGDTLRMSDQVFRNIWSNALHALYNAQRIVVIGYSFPSTDFYTEWLLRSARIDEDTTVRIVNPLNDPAHPDQGERERFVKRMQSLFPRGYDGQFTAFEQIPFNQQ